MPIDEMSETKSRKIKYLNVPIGSVCKQMGVARKKAHQ
jgi:hypothetical protein